MRRRRDVPDAVLSLVRPSPEVALSRISERLPALQQGGQRLDGKLSLVRGRRHRTRPDPPGATAGAPAAGGWGPPGPGPPRGASGRGPPGGGQPPPKNPR